MAFHGLLDLDHLWICLPGRERICVDRAAPELELEDRMGHPSGLRLSRWSRGHNSR